MSRMTTSSRQLVLGDAGDAAGLFERGQAVRSPRVRRRQCSAGRGTALGARSRPRRRRARARRAARLAARERAGRSTRSEAGRCSKKRTRLLVAQREDAAARADTRAASRRRAARARAPRRAPSRSGSRGTGRRPIRKIASSAGGSARSRVDRVAVRVDLRRSCAAARERERRELDPNVDRAVDVLVRGIAADEHVEPRRGRTPRCARLRELRRGRGAAG